MCLAAIALKSQHCGSPPDGALVADLAASQKGVQAKETFWQTELMQIIKISLWLPGKKFYHF